MITLSTLSAKKSLYIQLLQEEEFSKLFFQQMKKICFYVGGGGEGVLVGVLGCGAIAGYILQVSDMPGGGRRAEFRLKRRGGGRPLR